MARQRSKPTLMHSAARGAAAGLIGGAVLVTTHRVLAPRLPDRTRKGADAWDRRVGSAAKAVGLRLSPTTRTAIGVGTQLTCASMLGALYAIVTEQMEPSPATEDFVRAGIVFAASLFAPELQPRKRKPRGLRHKAQRKALRSITAPSMFGRATHYALRAMAR